MVLLEKYMNLFMNQINCGLINEETYNKPMEKLVKQ